MRDDHLRWEMPDPVVWRKVSVFGRSEHVQKDKMSVIWTSCLVGWNPLLGLACSWPLLSVTYAMNMFGNAVASPIVSSDAPNPFEATETLRGNHGRYDNSSSNSTDSSAKNEAADFSRSETRLCAALGTHGTRRGTSRPDSPAASLGHPKDGRESEERWEANSSRPRATTSPRRHRS